MFDSLLHTECKIVAKCLVFSGEQGWETEDLLYKFTHSEWGYNILKGYDEHEYACERFMYWGLARELGYKKGRVYPENVLWYTGYLYRYLCETCEPQDVYDKANISIIDKRYGAYHTQDWEYVKEDLGLC